jgi:hypothetical protein
MARFPLVFVAACAAVGCAERGLRSTVERNTHQGAIAQRDLDGARGQLAKLESDRAAEQGRVAQLQERLRLQNEALELQTKRLANAQRENDRMQTDLSAAVAGAAGAGPTVSPASGRIEEEPFRLSAGFVGRLKALSSKWNGVEYDARAKALRLPDATLFKPSGEIITDKWDLLKDVAAALAPDARDLKLLVQVNVPPMAAIRGMEKSHPTPWHLASYKAVNVEQRLEDFGVPKENLGISIQQFDRDRQGGTTIFFNPPDVGLAK